MAVGEAPRRLLVAGDAKGNLTKLYTQVENQQKRVGKFDALLAVGAFLPAPGEAEAAAAFAQYATGKAKAPVDTYFVESRSAALLQAAPDGKVLCEGLHFLGGYGIKEICGLRVAYLSGRYDKAVYKAQEAGASGPAFVGAAYTAQAVERLAVLCEEKGAPPVDVLLTAEWPSGIEEKMLDAQRPKHPEGLPITWSEVTVPPIADLCARVEPRYHVFGTVDIFYQRPPFQTPSRGHVCRCIGLGNVGSKGKGRLWIHGLALSAATSMPEVVLKLRPENTTPCPFALASAGDGAAQARAQALGEQPQGAKRDAEDMEANAEPAEDPLTVFLGRLPHTIDERRLRSALKHCGTIERVSIARDMQAEGQPCRGFAFVTFSDPEGALAAVDLHEMLEVNGRKISINLAKERQDGKKKREATIVIEPHADCWFCLVNPTVEKHMIVTATRDVYVAMVRGPISPMHVLVLPVKHAPCFAACPPDLQKTLQAHVQAIRKMCHESGRDLVMWERWLPQGFSSANHMMLQLLPVPRDRAGGAKEALEEAAGRHLAGATFKRVAAHSEVSEVLADADSTTPYIYFELPGENTAKGRQVERFIYVASPGGPRIPVSFGRQVGCQILGCEAKVDWRQCQEDRDAEKALAVAFREKFKTYQPKK